MKLETESFKMEAQSCNFKVTRKLFWETSVNENFTF